MDGNRRWAVENGYPKIIGHTYGARNLKDVALSAIDLGVDYLTLYALSTENFLNRSEDELKHLFDLFAQLIDYQSLFVENDVVFRAIGNIATLPVTVQSAISELSSKTSGHTGMTLTLCVNYGGRDEIVRAVRRLTESGAEITESAISSALDFSNLPDVDLVIRTGGHSRLSNFLTWQSTYSELYFTDTKWPAFKAHDLELALNWFGEQKRNQGK